MGASFVPSVPVARPSVFASGSHQLVCGSQSQAIPAKWTMGPWKPGEKDDAFRKQQEILARRRDAKKNEEYFEDVEKRRQELEEYRSERVLKVKEGEDPLIPWKVMKEKGFIDEAGYPDEEAGGSASGGIPLPMASFGIPKYDQGGRFDLKLPHADIGYESEDADVMGKIGKFFGFGKSKAKNDDDANAS